jgi:hypothetical protein
LRRGTRAAAENDGAQQYGYEYEERYTPGQSGYSRLFSLTSSALGALSVTDRKNGKATKKPRRDAKAPLRAERRQVAKHF